MTHQETVRRQGHLARARGVPDRVAEGRADRDRSVHRQQPEVPQGVRLRQARRDRGDARALRPLRRRRCRAGEEDERDRRLHLRARAALRSAGRAEGLRHEQGRRTDGRGRRVQDGPGGALVRDVRARRRAQPAGGSVRVRADVRGRVQDLPRRGHERVLRHGADRQSSTRRTWRFCRSATSTRWARARPPRRASCCAVPRVIPMHWGTFPVLTGTPASVARRRSRNAGWRRR